MVVSVDSAGAVRILSQQDQVSRAEILCLLRMVKHSHSFASCDDLALTLQAIVDDPVIKRMLLGATKASYSVTYGLAPFFHEQLVSDQKNSWYSLLCDETTTEQGIKQFDIHVRYWSESDDSVVSKYLTSAFLGHATAEDLKKSFVAALSTDGIPLSNMLHVGCDGPNVNKSLVDKINSALHDLNCNSLIDIGTCNLHVIHNGFHAGIASVDNTWGIEELLSDTLQELSIQISGF